MATLELILVGAGAYIIGMIVGFYIHATICKDKQESKVEEKISNPPEVVL